MFCSFPWVTQDANVARDVRNERGQISMEHISRRSSPEAANGGIVDKYINKIN
jgi:hypothetical protein